MKALTDLLKRHITAEELANTLTQGLGFLGSLLGFTVLLVVALVHGGRWQILSCAIYGISLVCLYAASTCAIYVLIAGTYTPFLLVNLKGAWGWSLFAVIWSIAISGIVFKLWFADRFPIFSTALYLAMGWLGIVATR